MQKMVVVGDGESSDTQSLCNHSRRFIQPLRPGFLDTFSIPRPFVKQLEGDLKGHSLQTVVLMSEHEPQRHWVVSVEGGGFFSVGWKDFCVHLDFQIGDFLVFTYHSHLLFHVSVFDPVSACERLLPSSTPDTLGPKANQVDLTATSETEAEQSLPEKDHLSCFVNLTSYNFRNSIIFLPVGFAREHGLHFRKCEMMIIDAQRREWEVSLNYKKSDGQSYIKRGWKSFLTENRLKPGNVLRLQFLKGGTCPTLKCYRENEIGEESNTTCKTTPEKAHDEDVTTTATSSPEQDESQHVTCYVNLSSYSVKNSIVYLSARFVRASNLKRRNCEVKVVDEEEKTWKASLGFKKTTYEAYICRGWRDIKNANRFRVGDVLCFQLLEAGKCPVFRCFRSSRGKKTRFAKARRRPVRAA
ncbi:hypothetical protein RND81_08G088800 [Saponaria officinalis]|uniref:TF-B3 domain-containing protein n=1 Tax=Saponaria officinalis TaxID=3572 RepID=A0AAW1J5H3_SAPOF